MLKLIQNVLERTPEHPSYKYFESFFGKVAFEAFSGKKFQGEKFNAPIVEGLSSYNNELI